MTRDRAISPPAAVTLCVAVFSVATGFLAGTAAFSARLAVVETEVRDMRIEVGRIADKVGARAPAAIGGEH